MPASDLTESRQPGFGSDLYLGLVRAIGTDLSDVISALEICFRRAGYGAGQFHTIKISGFFAELLQHARNKLELHEPPVALSEEPDGRYAYYRSRMDAGDWLRANYGGDILAQRAIVEVQSLRPRQSRAHRGCIYVIDSIMHPAEVELLRAVYGRKFFLIAVHSTGEHRMQKLLDELQSSDATVAAPEKPGDLPLDEADRRSREAYKAARRRCQQQVDELMRRDEGISEPDSPITSPAPPDRRVAIRRTFSDADVFVTLKETTDARSSRRLGVIERFVDKLFDEPFHTPTRAELGMSHAYVAARRSGSLARNVGAAICTPQGDVLAVGVNDVPAPGGGHYWPFYDGSSTDQRDHLYETELPSGARVQGFDSNDQVKTELFLDLMQRAFASVSAEMLGDPDQATLFGLLKFDLPAVVRQLMAQDSVRAAKFFDVIEYSRAVHAEMSALMSCLRNGISTTGAILYCTTFPCHECSRHIIAAGISRVVYVEPYSKSRVSTLHSDAVTVERFTGPAPLFRVDEATLERDDNRVRFEPFIGFSPNQQPHLYSPTRRKIEGEVANPESVGQKRHWVLGPNLPLRESISPRMPVARMAEDIMVAASEEWIEKTLSLSGLAPKHDTSRASAQDESSKPIGGTN